MPNQCYTIVRRANSIKVETCLFLIRWRVCQVILLAISFNLWPQRLSFTRLLGFSLLLRCQGVICCPPTPRRHRGLHARAALVTSDAAARHRWTDGRTNGRFYLGMCQFLKTQFFVLARTQHNSWDVDCVWFLHPGGGVEEGGGVTNRKPLSKMVGLDCSRSTVTPQKKPKKTPVEGLE